jgi:RNA-splicing ligase RtcB
MGIVVQYALESRKLIAMRICEALRLNPEESHTCIHNYIDTDHILRKGAISARQGEFVFMPLNMRDGSLIGLGLGNPDWNFSAPHGAGRACSRTDAKHAYSVEEYQEVM